MFRRRKRSEISVQQLRQAMARYFVIDVREPHEYAAGHVSGAVLIPKDTVMDRLAEIPTDHLLAVICQSGRRSAFVTDALKRRGYSAVNVAGGTSAWCLAGYPVITGEMEPSSTAAD